MDKPAGSSEKSFADKGPETLVPSGLDLLVLAVDRVERAQTAFSSAGVTDYTMDQLNHLIGQHVVRNVSFSQHGGTRRRTLTVAEVLNRAFIDHFQLGYGIRPAPSNARLIRKIDIFLAIPRGRMMSLAKCNNVLVGIALQKYRDELMGSAGGPNLSPERRKKLNNKFTTVQRTDRPADKKFLMEFCLRNNITEDTALADLEERCKVAVVLVDNNGYIENISTNITRRGYEIITILQGEGQMYLVTKLKGLCRVDTPKPRAE